MSDIQMTRHATMRMQQRGFRAADVGFMFEFGEACGDDGYRLTRHAAQQEIRRLKQQIHRLERLSGSVAIVCEGSVVTIHHGENANLSCRRRSRRVGNADRN